MNAENGSQHTAKISFYNLKFTNMGKANVYMWKYRRAKHEFMLFLKIGRKIYRQRYYFGIPSEILKLDSAY